MEELIISAIGNVGVPAVIAIYLLARIDKTIANLTQAINNNTQAIRQLENKVI